MFGIDFRLLAHIVLGMIVFNLLIRAYFRLKSWAFAPRGRDGLSDIMRPLPPSLTARQLPPDMMQCAGCQHEFEMLENLNGPVCDKCIIIMKENKKAGLHMKL